MIKQILFICLISSSCSLFKPVKEVKKEVRRKYIPRSERYISCIRLLNGDGIKQTLLKELCNSGLGEI